MNAYFKATKGEESVYYSKKKKMEELIYGNVFEWTINCKRFKSCYCFF